MQSFPMWLYLVLNKRGIVIAGIFGNQPMFDPDFITGIKENGFPMQIAFKNRIPKGAPKSVRGFIAGGGAEHS